MPLSTKNNVLNLIVHTFPVILFLLLIYAFYNIKHTGNIFNSYTIAIFVVFAFLALAASLYYNTTFVPALSDFLLFSTGIGLMVLLAALIYNTIIYYAATAKSAAYFVLILIAVVVGFALLLVVLSYMFSNQAIKELFGTILSLPGIIVDFAEEFSNQLPTSPPAFVILFVLEIILILIVALIPFLMSQNPPLYSTLQFNGVQLLQKDPLNLTTKNEAILANSDQLSVIDDPNMQQNPYQKQFSLSIWVYMNPSEAAQNPNEVTLFYYGSKEHDSNTDQWRVANPKPKITYAYDSITRRDMYYVYLQEETPDQPTYKFHIPNQKWNQFIFVFESDRVDLYINGHLEKSFPQSMGITKTFTNNDQIAVGDLHNASYGSIANVIYYDYPMTQNQVVDAWNKQKYWTDGSLYIPSMPSMPTIMPSIPGF